MWNSLAKVLNQYMYIYDDIYTIWKTGNSCWLRAHICLYHINIYILVYVPVYEYELVKYHFGTSLITCVSLHGSVKNKGYFLSIP